MLLFSLVSKWGTYSQQNICIQSLTCPRSQKQHTAIIFLGYSEVSGSCQRSYGIMLSSATRNTSSHSYHTYTHTHAHTHTHTNTHCPLTALLGAHLTHAIHLDIVFYPPYPLQVLYCVLLKSAATYAPIKSMSFFSMWTNSYTFW